MKSTDVWEAVSLVSLEGNLSFWWHPEQCELRDSLHFERRYAYGKASAVSIMGIWYLGWFIYLAGPLASF